MCCQTGLMALLLGSSIIQEIFDVGRMHNGKKQSRNMKQRQRKVIAWNRGDDSNLFLLLFLEETSQLSIVQ